eukprot:111150-Chlamydomonas_euryale.AAC.1
MAPRTPAQVRRTSGFPFAINVFVPLVDMTEEMGAPEFSIADHLSTCELTDELLKARCRVFLVGGGAS